MNGADGVAGSLSVMLESDTFYPSFLGLTQSWTVYDKSARMDFHILHNSKGYWMGGLTF